MKVKPKSGITQDKIRLIKSILSCFEQGSVKPKFDELYLLKDGPFLNGEKRRQITISVGVTQYGNMGDLLTRYSKTSGKYAAQFKPYLNKIKDPGLVNDSNFKSLLVKAAREDPIYVSLLDSFFDEKYIYPAIKWTEDRGMSEPLSYAWVCDSFLHSGTVLPFLLKKFPEVPPSKGGSERAYGLAYLKARKNWLQNHTDSTLKKLWTRPNWYIKQMENGNWKLDKFPISPNGVSISS